MGSCKEVTKTKVLSLTEPYATLILKGSKRVETRSWKTSYRGELYIHASRTKISNNELQNNELMVFVGHDKLNFGSIICKCDLVDCISMTEEYVEDIKKNHPQEYSCGIYREGRYAWILENVTPLKNSIKAKGQLNIWNFYDEFEVMELMNEIEYGYLDNKKKKHKAVDEAYSDCYSLQSPKEIIQNKVGVCWDQVELERYYLKGTDWNVKTFFMVHYDGNQCPSHTFLTFEKENQYQWLEHSWERFRGIHQYNSLKELLLDVRDKFIKYELNNQYEKENLVLQEYKKPNYHISALEFYNHCERGISIDLDE